ncbi:helix-hairpin-helix domain-containing protein [Sphingobacterium arenae]|uniref:Helix-hairpin-helix domain-containing protein n=1 Tax=Sphingobacterium arenae TaxID=1280598 RepID=A0ABR7Y3W0_9SPHI|nr:helix-hairpin-helix domain-containing protein [Sphingobacterium arenae]MBD1425994.1 helix-hairpin-helix domain-containing protein [Sphingobacterium arenae]
MKKLAILFGMSENERRGFLMFSILIGLIGVAPLVYGFYVKHTADDKLLVFSTIEAELKTFESKPEEIYDVHKVAKESLFPFDPNNLPVEKWKMLGFTEKQIQVIKNYELKGGSFRIKADVAKLYVVSDEDFKRIAPYITLPETVSPLPSKVVFSSKESKKPFAKKVIVVDLAIADTAALQEIHGIGPVLASRIVKFRDALGGFHRIDQVREVYGISEEQFERMESSLALDAPTVKKWAINQLPIEELAQHPYISRKEATHIVRYREQHGAFASLTDLEKVYALNADFLRKIAFYLDFN